MVVFWAGQGWADEATTKNFPATRLRGYGTLSGKYSENGTGGSVLKIDCQDAEHARLVQAKYLSDLEELPPGTKPGQIEVGGVRISIRTAEDVGALAVLRNGTSVVVVTAKIPDALSKSIPGAVTGDLGSWTSEAEGKVPMFLDRFDKYGFRFYYAPGNLKPGPNGRGDPNYDVREDFDFMQANHAGLLLWHGGQQGETAEGLTKEPRWDWALGEAKAKGLSFGINLGIESGAYWYYNRNPGSLMQFAPGFLGTYYGSMNFGIGPMVAWSSADGQDAMLGQLQTTVRRYRDVDNITSWLEPHEELGHGPADLLADTGPGADANFRDYLRGKYKTLKALSLRWYGSETALKSWDDVRVPEPADFLGWTDDAIDLAGKWRVNYEVADNPAALATNFDDSKWGEMYGPGHGLARLLPQKPDVWRRHIKVDQDWLTKHPAPWLYVWDMNDTRAARKDPAQAVVVSVNGQTVPEDHPVYDECHWAALNVAEALHAGDNLVAIRLPRGLFNYRVYLSGDEPKSYPELGEGMNAEWVDFSDWTKDVRTSAVRRGMQMIRQVDPDRGIVLMAPDSFADGILEQAIDYGGDFHNTGYMGGWWCDKLPALMRGAGLPFSVEPSQGPTLPVHLQGAMGNWITQGCNAIDFFQTIGEVLYHPDLKKCFEDHATLYTSIGRYHAVPAQVAALYSNRINNLLGFPWRERPAEDNGQPYFRGGGYPSGFNSRGHYTPMEHVPNGPMFESDAVTEMMFTRDQVGKYRVVVDTDTAVMDEETINGIERYVRAGGVFVTCGETGRHSPEKPDSWPIDRVTGFHIANPVPEKGSIFLDGSQKVFGTDWAPNGDLTGHHFTAVAPEAQNLLTWNDGTTAVGLRPLGKGYVVTVGPWFNLEMGNAFYSRLFQWLKLDPIPGRLETTGPEIFWRHFLSNNGLYDVWVVRNTNSTQPVEGTLILADGLRPGWRVDLNTGVRSAVTDGRLAVSLPPAETAIYITPRAGIAQTSAEWFALQRGWWQGTVDPGKPLPKPEMKLTVDLTDGWTFQPVDVAQTDVSALVAATVDDRKWKQIRMGVLTLPDNPDVRHAVVRKHFHVPEKWNHGRVILRLPQFRDLGTVYIDGQVTTPGVAPTLAPGSDHVVAVEVQGKQMLIGANGCAWLTYHPDPVGRQNLAGHWELSLDAMVWNTTVPLPGPLAQGTKAMRTVVLVDAAAKGKTVVFHATQQSSELSGLIINGNYLAPPRESSEMNINITPWVRPGQNNEIILFKGGSRETVNDVSLEFHQQGTYP
jgi:hypothetical protein